MEFLEGCAEGIRRLIAVFQCYINDFSELSRKSVTLLTAYDCASILLKSIARMEKSLLKGMK